MLLIAINRHQFFLLDAIDKNINSLLYEKQQFSTKQQSLEFYAIYADIIIENRSALVKKMKDKNL